MVCALFFLCDIVDLTNMDDFCRGSYWNSLCESIFLVVIKKECGARIEESGYKFGGNGRDNRQLRSSYPFSFSLGCGEANLSKLKLITKIIDYIVFKLLIY